MTAVTPEQMAAWSAHTGRSETRRQTLDPTVLERFAVALDESPDILKHWPSLGHWAFFTDNATRARTGEDGHPLRGGLLPPITLARRMFAAGDIRFLAPLAVGAEADLSITVADVRLKSGKSGDLVFVDVERRIAQEGTDRVLERQTLVYRDAGAPMAPVEPAVSLPPGEAVWTPGPVDLFKFSAATGNAHRIHYDADYARQTEGYPALVVHGPFSAARLFGHLRRQLDAPLTRFAFRANAPLFVSQPVTLARGLGANEALALRCDGATAMTAEASA